MLLRLTGIALFTPSFPFRSSTRRVLLKFHPENSSLLRDGDGYVEACYRSAKLNLHQFRAEPSIWNWLFFWQACTQQQGWKVSISEGFKEQNKATRVSVHCALQLMERYLPDLTRIREQQEAAAAAAASRSTRPPPASPRLPLPSSPSVVHAPKTEAGSWDEKRQLETRPLELEALVRGKRGLNGHVQSLLYLNSLRSCGEAVIRLSEVPIHGSLATRFGTAFLVSERLLVTCAHVIPDIDIARHGCIVVEFDVHSSIPPEQRQTGRLLPDDCFWAHRSADGQVDIAIIAFEYVSPAARQRPYISLRAGFDTKGRDLDNQLNILSHPDGKEQCLSTGTCTGSIAGYACQAAISYDTDTMPGSSGAPVVNLLWQLVAVHHGHQSQCNRGTTCTAIVRLLQHDRQTQAQAIRSSPQKQRMWELLEQCYATAASR